MGGGVVDRRYTVAKRILSRRGGCFDECSLVGDELNLIPATKEGSCRQKFDEYLYVALERRKLKKQTTRRAVRTLL